MCKVLYIDDDIHHGLFFKTVCQQKNVDCDTVDNLVDAKTLIENNKYDIYITDFLLGGYTGYDIINEYPDKGWFLITSLTESLVPDRIKEDKKITKILYKPMSVSQTLQVIDDYIKCK